MKNFLSQIVFIIFCVLFLKCTVLKQPPQKDTNTSVTIAKPILSSDTVAYIVQNKLERKSFFKNSDRQQIWVDSIFNKMTLDEKIGQLFMVAAYSNKEDSRAEYINKLIVENKIGGLLFFKGSPMRQAKLTNKFQAKSKIPLFIGIDAEWGLNMRLDSTFKYPYNMTLGAIRNVNLIEKMGANMGRECKRMGIHFNFTPVIDINTNPNNPIIGNRSFGEDKIQVTDCAIALMTGIQKQGVFATGKHFPGHGDSATDSHQTLPTINLSRQRINLVELYPYKRMFDEGLESVMVAHLNVPSLELQPNCPSSISYNVVTNLLQHELGFDGLIFTDALNMKGASNFKKPGDLDLDAFKAGNDILLFPENVPLAYEKICKAIEDSSVTIKRLDFSVKKILNYKFKAGLNNCQPIDTSNLVQDLNSESNNALQYELYENAITVLKNENEILPLKKLDEKIAFIKIGEDSNDAFINTLNKYTLVTEIKETNLDSLKVKLKYFDKVIIGVHKSDKAFKKQEISLSDANLIKEISKCSTVIVAVFLKPYALAAINDFTAIKGLILSYQNADVAQEVSAELIFGAIEAKGKLPVSIGSNFKINEGLTTSKLNRLGFSSPENVGMSFKILSKIDAIAKKAITLKCAPGMQILVARKGKVIYQKSFGSPTYENTIQVNNTNIYDVASLSKIISTLPNVIQQFDKNKIILESELGSVLPTFKNSNKEHIDFKHLLSHYAGLKSWIPFYKATIDSSKTPLTKYYSKVAQPNFAKKVSDSLFIRNDYSDTIMKLIIDSKLEEKVEYKYSDFTFMILKKYLETVTARTLDDLSYSNFFKTLGMNNTMYNPLNQIDKNKIIPTEIDAYFRHSLLQGYVHDMAAAMQGGVAGHAGVFSNAMDIAKMMQMYLQKGNYGGIDYFKNSTFDVFNTCYFCNEGNRRGLGFDKPELDSIGNLKSKYVSKSSFGHTGFTGVMAWADPETEIIYIFVSNRTYPDGNAPNKLSKEHIREQIQQIIYEALLQ